MRFLTVAHMRAADQAAITEKKIPAMVLMNRAGTALARAVEKAATLRGVKNVVVIAGHGNNGGDACVAARCLYEDGFHVQVVMTCVPASLKGSAREAWDGMRTQGVPYVVLAAAESWIEDMDVFSGALLRNGVIVDGVLGTGCKGKPQGAAEKAIQWMNRMRSYAFVVSADLPSGMNGDTGESEGALVRADVTVTFARPKCCFLNQAQSACVGHLVVADIGIPDEICERNVADAAGGQSPAAGESLAGAQGRVWPPLRDRRISGVSPRARVDRVRGVEKRRWPVDAGRPGAERYGGGRARAGGDGVCFGRAARFAVGGVSGRLGTGSERL
jgi:hydroxyethylthiazole kinase-like uncharacterized protein yjeF